MEWLTGQVVFSLRDWASSREDTRSLTGRYSSAWFLPLLSPKLISSLSKRCSKACDKQVCKFWISNAIEDPLIVDAGSAYPKTNSACIFIRSLIGVLYGSVFWDSSPQFTFLSLITRGLGEGREQSLPFIMLVKLYELCSLSSSLCMHTRMYNSKIERSVSMFSLH